MIGVSSSTETMCPPREDFGLPAVAALGDVMRHTGNHDSGHGSTLVEDTLESRFEFGVRNAPGVGKKTGRERGISQIMLMHFIVISIGPFSPFKSEVAE
jgi:hypothetical protein